jgi:hypothetical protein
VSNTIDKGCPNDAAPGSHVGNSDGLIDVNGMRFGELSNAIGADDLNRALDYILASGQNGSGHHGFSSSI